MHALAPIHHDVSRAQRRKHDPILLLGRPGRLCDALRSALSGHDVASTSDPRQLRTREPNDALVMVTIDSPPPSGRWLRGWREHAARQAWEDRLTETVIDAAGDVPGFRVLLLCDTSGPTSSRAAVRATRQLGRRMSYECAVNGAPINSITYVVVDAATPATTAVNAAVTWYFTHQGVPSE